MPPDRNRLPWRSREGLRLPRCFCWKLPGEALYAAAAAAAFLPISLLGDLASLEGSLTVCVSLSVMFPSLWFKIYGPHAAVSTHERALETFSS